MTNGEKAEIVALVCCAMEGLVTGKSATSVRARAARCLGHFDEVRAAVGEFLDGRAEPAAVVSRVFPEQPRNVVFQGGEVTYVESPRVVVGSALASLKIRVREYLGDKSRRQNVIEKDLGLAAGALDGVLTAENGFEVNAQGWVRVLEKVGAG